MIVSRRRACRSRIVAAYAGNFSAAWSAYCGKLLSCIAVGTSAVPCATIPSIRSVVRPVPCSMQSMPASMRIGSTSVPKQCAVTLAPSACAVSIAAMNASAGNDGARSPGSRSIQSPTSLTQPSPRRASCSTYVVSSSGSTSHA